MQKNVKAALAVAGLAVVTVLVLAATKPDQFKVQRSTTIAASPATIQGYINDFKQWRTWSPWEDLDPNLKRTYTGRESGEGAVYEWDGNDKAGQGRMEITHSDATRTTINLTFLKPFKASNISEFGFEPQGESTRVTWTMTGDSPFICKVMQVFCDMDKMCGGDFDKGLTKLKAEAEKKVPAHG